MTTEERDEAFRTLITCDGKGKEAKTEALRKLVEASYWDGSRAGYATGVEDTNSAPK